jgi:hypothetical protein
MTSGSQPLFVFTADLHLEDGAWSTRPGIYGDAYYSFSQIVAYCIEHELPLILGGDVLEKKSNSARPIAKLCEGLTQMQAAHVPVYYIQGNHEYDRNAPWLSVHEWPIHMHEARFDINGVSVCGFDWLPRGEIQEAFKRVPTTVDILITHQVWKDFMGNVGRTECELTDVHHVRTVLAGDFHVTKIAEGVGAQSQSVRMLSPGSICMQDNGESPEKFFFVVERTESGAIDFRSVKLRTRRFLEYIVNSQDLLDSLCAGQLTADIAAASQNDLPADIKKPIVRVKFDKRLPDAYLRIVTVVGETAHLFCEAIVDRGMQPRQNAARMAAKNDLLSALGDLLGEDTDAYKLGAALLNSEDIAKEFDEQFSKHMTGELEDATLAVGSEELGAPSV